ncbi:MAG: ribosome small subunit-dependent GTPase A [Oliverpabstia sp.]|nr:ribosome small subunit-dependent GTPase A [Oliverpabstia sp.]
MQGKIIKGIAGFYYVDVVESGIYECKAKGIFRKEKMKPLVGDNVEIEVLDEEEKTGNLIGILPRKNQLIRPAAANVDQAMVIFAVRQPDPNYVLLDRFLITMEQQDIPVIICFNKSDLAEEKQLEQMCRIYEKCGYQILITSASKEEGISQVRNILEGKTTVVAGPSGVGKSSITNLLQEEISMETGEISKKLKRGKHTTRHSQLITVGEQTYLMDTPGFSSLFVEGIEKEELRLYFPEFREYEGNCRFQGCVHVHEPGCSVKEAVEMKKISSQRYENYVSIYEELKEKEKRRY